MSRKIGEKGKMTHEDAGHYAAKHPEAKIDSQIAEAIADKDKDGRITCAAAHAIAKKLSVPPHVVGKNIDLLEKRIHFCQMGLFGHPPETVKAITPMERVPQELEQAIREALIDGKLTCKAAWDLADKMQMSKSDLASACEALEIKIKKCQLGAF